MNLYDVTFFIKSPRGYELPDSLTLNHNFIIERVESEYRVLIRIDSENAQQALVTAKEQTAAFGQLLALRDSGWQIIEDGRQKVARIDAPFVAEGPPPPADVVGGVMTPQGVEVFDPTEQWRRSGRVFNIFAEGKLKHTDLSEELALFAEGDNWTDSIRSALSLLHLGTLQTNLTMNLVLSYTALEIIADKKESPLIHQAIGGEDPRKALLSDLRTVLLERGMSADQANRILSSVENTRNQSQLDHFATYFAERNINMPIENLRKVRRLRGQLVHNGALATGETKGLINQFCLAVRSGIRLDLGGTKLFG